MVLKVRIFAIRVKTGDLIAVFLFVAGGEFSLNMNNEVGIAQAVVLFDAQGVISGKRFAPLNEAKTFGLLRLLEEKRVNQRFSDVDTAVFLFNRVTQASFKPLSRGNAVNDAV